MRLGRAIAATLAAVAIASCGASDEAEGPRPLERAEANRLADALFDNFRDVGAEFTYTGRLGDETLVLDGSVDFVEHSGRARVRASGPESHVSEVYWTESEVFERIDGLPGLVSDLGGPSADWVVRPPDLERRELDTAISIIVGLASERRDNPQLIMQLPGSQFVRSQELDGRPVDVLRYGEITTYWLDATSGDTVRFEANVPSAGTALVIDLDARGPTSFTRPSDANVVRVDAIDELYESLSQQ